MDKKHFEMTISIHVEADSPEQALELLLNEKSLRAIASAIEANRENIKEIYKEDEPVKLIN